MLYVWTVNNSLQSENENLNIKFLSYNQGYSSHNILFQQVCHFLVNFHIFYGFISLVNVLFKLQHVI